MYIFKTKSNNKNFRNHSHKKPTADVLSSTDGSSGTFGNILRGRIEAVAEVFYKKGVRKNFVKLTRQGLCRSLFFHEVAGFHPTTLLKTIPLHRCLLVNFAKFFSSSVFYRALLGGWTRRRSTTRALSKT